jgi:hypothetical protein
LPASEPFYDDSRKVFRIEVYFIKALNYGIVSSIWTLSLEWNSNIKATSFQIVERHIQFGSRANFYTFLQFDSSIFSGSFKPTGYDLEIPKLRP